MRIVIISLLLFSSVFAWPTGTTKTMRIIVNSSRVNETATNFVHQLNLSDSIAKIDSLIDSTKHVAVCLPDGSTLKPKDIVYVEGKKFLIYWDGAKHTTVNDTFYLCFGTGLNAVNSTATYSNSNESNRWGIDKFSGNTFYDYVGSNNGTGSSVDTATSTFGVGGSCNATTDYINLGQVAALQSKAAFTMTMSVKQTSIAGTYFWFYANTSATARIEVQISGSALYITIGNGSNTYGYATIAGIFSTTNTNLVSIVYNGEGATNRDKLQLYINGANVSLTFSGTLPSAAADLATNMYIGRTTSSIVGVVDEVGIMSVSRSANAVLDRYRALFEPSTFYSIGAITDIGRSGSRGLITRILNKLGIHSGVSPF